MKKGIAILAAGIFLVSMAGCAPEPKPAKSVTPEPTPSASVSAAPSSTPAPYPVGVKSPFEQRGFSEEECKKALEGLEPLQGKELTLLGGSSPVMKRLGDPQLCFEDEAGARYNISLDGGKFLSYVAGNDSQKRTDAIDEAEGRQIAEQIVSQFAPGKYDLSKMELSHEKTGFPFSSARYVFNWTSTVHGVNIRHGACVAMDERGNVGTVLLEYNYGFEPDATAIKITDKQEAERRLLDELCADPMVEREGIHIVYSYLTVYYKDPHRVVWAFRYELDSPDGSRTPGNKYLDAITNEWISHKE